MTAIITNCSVGGKEGLWLSGGTSCPCAVYNLHNFMKWSWVSMLVQVHLHMVFIKEGNLFFASTILFFEKFYFNALWPSSGIEKVLILANISLAYYSMQYPWGRIKYFLRCCVVLEMVKRASWLWNQEVLWYPTPAGVGTIWTLDPIFGQNLVHHKLSGSGG